MWLGACVGLALIALVALLLTSSERAQSAFQWVSHTQSVIQTIDETVADLHEAESAQRGFLITRNPAFITGVSALVRDARRGNRAIDSLVRDNPVQVERSHELREAIDERVRTMRIPLILGRQGRFDEARALVSRGHGRDIMTRVAVRAEAMKQEERGLLAERVADSVRRATWNRNVVMIGGPAVILLLLFVILFLVRSIERPLHSMLASMHAFGSGDCSARVTAAMGSVEFERLAAGYNAMADQLGDALGRQHDDDQKLQAANTELRERGEELADRGQAIGLLGGMAHRMQSARSDEELAEIVDCFVPRVLPAVPGALYAHNHSRNLLVRLAAWGGIADAPETFAPDACWSLRRGQSHAVPVPGMDIVCDHVADPSQPYACEPLLAGGEVIGMLYLEGVVTRENCFRLAILTENISSALTNQRLQRGLREQTIRDPLTGLFNRRYMEETLAIEIARASRGTPLSVVMCDIDHFKHFNDEFGHDAGDALLRAVAAEMGKHFRDGDVVCRYGGEEFTVIAPGAEPHVLIHRVEIVRAAIADLVVLHNGRTLGSVSMSFGIAGYTDRMARDGSELVQVADAALYRAKRNGRNQAIIADQQAA